MAGRTTGKRTMSSKGKREEREHPRASSKQNKNKVLSTLSRTKAKAKTKTAPKPRNKGKREAVEKYSKPAKTIDKRKRQSAFEDATLGLAKQLVKTHKHGLVHSTEGMGRKFPSPARFVAQYALMPMAGGTFGGGAQGSFWSMMSKFQKVSHPSYGKRVKSSGDPVAPKSSRILNAVNKRLGGTLVKDKGSRGKGKKEGNYFVQEPDDDWSSYGNW